MCSYKKVFSFSAVFFLLIFHGNAQEVLGKTIIRSLLDSVKKNVSYTPNIENLSETDLQLILKGIQEHTKDSSFNIRWNLALLADQVMWQTKNEEINQEVTSIMMTLFDDSNSRISFLAEQSIMRYPYYCFNLEHKKKLVELAEKTTSPTKKISLFKLCSRINADEIIPTLQENAYNKNNSFRVRWASLVALTRFGDKQAEEELVSYANRLPISLDVIDILYPDIIFSRSHKAVSILVKQILESNETCESSNPNNSLGVPCGYMILRILAPHIKEINWNGKTGLENLTPDEALSKARIFFIKKKDTWELIEGI